jgi:hypothetical protein
LPFRAHPHQAEAVIVERVADECETFLNGRLLDRFYDQESPAPIPCWVWLSKLAHSTESEIAALGIAYRKSMRPEYACWERVISYLAGRIVVAAEASGGSVASLQHDRLVPLELELMSPNRHVGPSTLLRMVVGALPDGSPTDHDRAPG